MYSLTSSSRVVACDNCELSSTMSIVSVVSKNSGALNRGGATAVVEFLQDAFRLRSTDTVRRSSGFGLVGSRFPRNSDCCLCLKS